MTRMTMPAPQSAPALQVFDLFGDGTEYLNVGAAFLFLSRKAPDIMLTRTLREQCRVSTESGVPARPNWPVIVVQRGRVQHIIDNNELVMQARDDQPLLTLTLGELDAELLRITPQDMALHSDPEQLRRCAYVTLLRVVPPSGDEMTYWLGAWRTANDVHQHLGHVFKSVFGQGPGKRMAQRASDEFKASKQMLLRLDEPPYELQLLVVPTEHLQNTMN